MKAVPDAVIDDGLLDAIAVEGIDSRLKIATLPRFILGTHAHLSWRTPRAVKLHHPLPWHDTANLDGEPIPCDVAKFVLLKRPPRETAKCINFQNPRSEKRSNKKEDLAPKRGAKSPFLWYNLLEMNTIPQDIIHQSREEFQHFLQNLFITDPVMVFDRFMEGIEVSKYRQTS